MSFGEIMSGNISIQRSHILVGIAFKGHIQTHSHIYMKSYVNCQANPISNLEILIIATGVRAWWTSNQGNASLANGASGASLEDVWLII